MKAKKTLVLVLILLCATHSLKAQYTITLSDVDFDANTGTIKDYTNSTEKDIIIPSSFVVDGNEVAVKCIGSSAFANNALTSVTIPTSVTTIDGFGFSSNQLTSITIPNSITHLGGGSFYNNLLTSVTIPNSVTRISSSSFYKNRLTSVTIPNSITAIEASTFEANLLTSVTIPNNVVSIGQSAFAKNQLTSIIIPNSVKSIGIESFMNNKLTSVTIYDGLINIGQSAFAKNQLTSITIPNSVTSIGSCAFIYNQFISFKLPIHSSYNSYNWRDNNSITYAGGDFVTNLNISYRIPVYSIHYHLNGGENSENNPNLYIEDDGINSFEDPVKIGYSFKGWYGNESFGGEAITEIEVGKIGEVSLWAKFTLTQYNITYHVNQGEKPTENPANYTIESEKISLVPASKEGYTFEGWYANEEFSGGTIIEIAKGSHGEMSLWAKFTPIEYAISYHVDEGGNPAENPAIYTIESEKISLVSAIKEGYSFMGWFANAEFTGEAITEIATGSNGNMSLWAKFTPIEYAITYHLDEGENPSENPTNYTIESEKISLAPATTSKDDYEFKGWFANAEFTGEAITEIAAGSKGNMSLWANFGPLEYAITYHVGEGENAAENPTTYTLESEKISLAAASKEGYTFEGWYANAEFTGEAITEITAGSKGEISLWAKYTPIEYTITYHVNNGVNSAENPASYTIESEKISLASASKEGYTFEGWYANAEFTGEAITEIAAGSKGNMSLWAKYIPIEYTITYHLNEGENAAENPATYTIESDKIVLAAPSKENSNFEGWYANNEFTGKAISEIATGSMGDRELWANWEKITGVKEFVKSNYKFYPNPVVDVLTIESKELAEAIIYNLTGSIVKRFKLKSNKHQEKIGDLKSGVYYLKLGDKILKLIKK